MPTVTRLTSNGVFQSSGGFDEVSLNSGSIRFNGSTDYLSVPYSSNFEFSNKNFTIEFWMYAQSDLTGQGIMAFPHNVDNLAQVLFYGNGSSLLLFSSSNGTLWDVSGGVVAMNITLGAWNHIAVSKSGSSIRCFANGILQGTVTFAGTFTGTYDRCWIGDTASNMNYNGLLSNIRVVNGTALYTANFIPLQTSLLPVSNTVLLLTNSSINPFKDSSINNFTITKVSNPTFNTLGPFYFPANTSINLANTNNNPLLGSNTNIVTSTTSNGVVMVSNEFDEVSMSSGSISFNGSNQRLFNSTTNCTTFGTNDFTVEYWVNYQSLNGSYQQIIGSALTSNGFAFGINAGRLYMTTISVGYGSSGAVLSTGQWYHVAFVRQSGIVKFYLNGISDNTVTAATDITELGTSIGGYSNTLYLSNALISNIRVIKGTALYTSNFTPPQTALLPVANTSLLLNTFAAEPFVDNSPNNFTLTRVGTPSANTLSSFANTQRKILNTGTMMTKEYDEWTGVPVVDSSLKLWLDAGQPASYPGSGTTWTDVSGLGNNGTLVSGATYNSDNGGSIALDGSTGYVLLGPIPEIGISTSSFTMGIWVYPTGAAGNIVSMSSTNPSGSWNMPPIAATGQKFRGKIWSNNYLYSTSTYTLNTWYYVVLVFDYVAGAQRFYVNGDLQDSQTGISYGSSGTNNYLFLGQSNPGADNTGMFPGKISNFHIHNRALTATEILQNFNALRKRYGI